MDTLEAKTETYNLQAAEISLTLAGKRFQQKTEIKEQLDSMGEKSKGEVHMYIPQNGFSIIALHNDKYYGYAPMNPDVQDAISTISDADQPIYISIPENINEGKLTTRERIAKDFLNAKDEGRIVRPIRTE